MARPEIFDVPPLEAVRHFRAKGYRIGFDFRDTVDRQHLEFFTVAKAMDLDVLEAVRGEMDRAIAEGITLGEFSNALEPRLVEMGWWGKAEMVDPLDPDAGPKLVQLGSMRRLKTIFETNIATSYARGRWERIERVAQARPWLMYVAIRDGRTRPEHLAWHGTIRRWDDEFWQTHYPPCGWGCRCYVIQLSDADLRDMGLKETPRPRTWDTTRAWRNERTGETVQVPVGIDPGFQHNVGLLDPVLEERRRLEEKLEAADPALAAAARTAIAAGLSELMEELASNAS